MNFSDQSNFPDCRLPTPPPPTRTLKIPRSELKLTEIFSSAEIFLQFPGIVGSKITFQNFTLNKKT